MKVGTDAVLLGAWAKTEGVSSILDIGTGTGVIALMLAQRSPAVIDAIDIDRASCEQARGNVQASPWADRVHVEHIALQEYVRLTDKKYDLIVSNPPYFVDSSKASEEGRARARHADLLPFPDLLDGVTRLLNKDGRFCVILPIKEGQIFRDLAARKLFLNKMMRVKTTPDKPEKRLLMEFGFTQKTFSESSIILEKDSLNEQHYTEEYRELTKAYYLYF